MDAFKERNDNLRVASIAQIKDIISGAELPPHALETVQKALDSISGMITGTSEYSNSLAYIDYLVKLPWHPRTTAAYPENIQDQAGNSLGSNVENIRSYFKSKIDGDSEQVKILVVDDEKIALRNLSHLLRKEGYDVVTCENGEDAIQFLENSVFDIVMTDLRMANIDGIEVLRKAKSISPDTRVILITGYATTETAVEAMRKGAFHYIMKPVQIDELRLIIKEALVQKRSKPSHYSVLCLTGGDEADRVLSAGTAASSVGRKFIEIPMENMAHESDISGISRVNGGTSPGCIMNSISLAGSSDSIIILKNIDKLNKDLAPLIHNLMLPDKNRYFIDNYLEIPFDLSQVIFITTAENPDNVPSPLDECLEILEIR